MTNHTPRHHRRLLLTAGVAGGLAMFTGNATASAQPRPGIDGPPHGRPAGERRNLAAVTRAFERQNAGGDIYEILHDDVEWTIVNGRTYPSKAEFLAEGAAPIMDRLATTLMMRIRDMWADGDTVIVRFDGDATAIDGVEYHNEYCWIWQLRRERVVRCYAFLDLIAVRELIDRIELD
ncbi:nuclear transport factor 2 family protein [Micromonospora zingiberis]|nr:nuclear transport factor 2 family protein [Micromonospora zingiberis]